jgi:hypothetical protein
VEQPSQDICGSAGAPECKNRRQIAVDPRLDEQLAERRMRCVRSGRGKNDLDQARCAQHARLRRVIDDVQPAQLDVVVAIDGHAQHDFDAVLLVHRRPGGTGGLFMQIDENATAIESGVFSPSRYRQRAPVAVAAA